MAENSSPFSTVEYGEWETVGDRVTRRKRMQERFPELFIWEYRIEREFEGEIIQANGEFPPEMLADCPLETFNEILRTQFAYALTDVLKRREGEWVTST